jgi:CTP synthase (UTP-ammonia lyase)
MREPSAPVRIGVVGDFDRHKPSHWATEAALFHAAARLGLTVAPCWLPTTTIAGPGGVEQLAACDGIWGAPGSPYASMEGMLRAIQYARERDLVYLGTCGGFQYALIEFSRNVLGIADADTAENAPNGRNIVITPVECAAPDRATSGPRLAGTGVARVLPDTLLERLCGAGDLRGEYFCNFETNASFVARWEAAGLAACAVGAAGEVRAFELPHRGFFLATLFQPQLSSSYERPHAIVLGYLRACARR